MIEDMFCDTDTQYAFVLAQSDKNKGQLIALEISINPDYLEGSVQTLRLILSPFWTKRDP